MLSDQLQHQHLDQSGTCREAHVLKEGLQVTIGELRAETWLLPGRTFTSHDALRVFGFGSEDVWPEHRGQVLDAHPVTAGVALDLVQKPARANAEERQQTQPVAWKPVVTTVTELLLADEAEQVEV